MPTSPEPTTPYLLLPTETSFTQNPSNLPDKNCLTTHSNYDIESALLFLLNSINMRILLGSYTIKKRSRFPASDKLRHRQTQNLPLTEKYHLLWYYGTLNCTMYYGTPPCNCSALLTTNNINISTTVVEQISPCGFAPPYICIYTRTSVIVSHLS